MSIYENYVTILNVNDGAPGEPGAPGKDTQKYRIETNQSEVLKYYISGDAWNFAPNNLVISVCKANPNITGGQEIVAITSAQQFKFQVYDSQKGWLDFSFPQNTDKIIYSTIVNNNLILYLDKLKDYAGTFLLEGETIEEYNQRISSENELHKILKTLTETETVLRIKYELTIEEGSFFAEQIIRFRHAMTEDMAKLALKAGGIYASVANSALEFTADGLTVRNGSFRIYNTIDLKEEPVFWADEKGNLHLTGYINAIGGSFTGSIYAEEGSFSGQIKANSGTIGGFTIELDKLVSNDGNSIILDGKNGQVIANNITLGTGALISDYLSLGDNVKILNPDKNNGTFLEVFKTENENKITSLSFNQNGSIILGDLNGAQIKIDGAAQEIRGWNPQKDNKNFTWSLSPEESVFNNLIARGSIKAATFEYGTVQAIGGAILIRPSSRITSVEGTKITLETALGGFGIDDICLVENNDGSEEYCQIVGVEDKTLTLSKSLPTGVIGSPIVNLGKKNSIGIGINGSNSQTYNISPGTISVLEFDGEESLISRIILGKLPDLEIYGNARNSYGLYAENVVLNGSLTTKTAIQNAAQAKNAAEDSYSGIGTTLGTEGAPNTANIIDAEIKFPGKKLGQILLWAGAENSSKEGIENSKFFVDQYGNMYAGSGFFDGTIITNSVIEAAEIKTAVLTGTGTGPALRIQDVKEGIHFYKNKGDGTSDLVFQLSSEDFKVNGLKVSLNDKFIITKEGGLELSRIELKDGLTVDGRRISYLNSFVELPDGASVSISPDGSNKFTIDQSGFVMNGSLFYAFNNEIKSEYKQVVENNQVVGYDLYIY